MLVDTHYKHVCEGQREQLIFFKCYPADLLKQGLSVAWSSPIRLGWLDSKIYWSLPLQHWNYKSTILRSCLQGAKDLRQVFMLMLQGTYCDISPQAEKVNFLYLVISSEHLIFLLIINIHNKPICMIFIIDRNHKYFPKLWLLLIHQNIIDTQHYLSLQALLHSPSDHLTD